MAEASAKLAENGWISQIALSDIVPKDGVFTIALQQPDNVYWVITFAFVGLEVFTSLIAFVLLFLLKVEKNIGKEQAEIKARHEASQGTDEENRPAESQAEGENER